MAHARRKDASQVSPPAETGIEAFGQPASEEGLSLDQLSQAFADMLRHGDDPYEPPAEEEPTQDAVEIARGREPADDEADLACELSPRSILEALLFVGAPGDRPMPAARVAELMRGVRPAEIDDLVADLNAQYETANCPYTIASEADGYRLVLRAPFRRIRDKALGRVRQATLSPAAIEVLSLVAYHPGLTRDEVNALRKSASGAILSQLVRRELLRIEREDQTKPARYHTTQRFLDLSGLASLEELPHSEDVERK